MPKYCPNKINKPKKQKTKKQQQKLHTQKTHIYYTFNNSLYFVTVFVDKEGEGWNQKL